MTNNEMKETIRNMINDAWNDYQFMKRTYGIESYECIVIGMHGAYYLIFGILFFRLKIGGTNNDRR